MRTLIFVIITVLLGLHSPTIAQAASGVEKRGFITETIGNTFGGAKNCVGPSRRELQTVSCATKNFAMIQVQSATHDLDYAIESLLFEELAKRSADASECQLGFLKAYASDPSISTALNQESFKAFQKVEARMHKLVAQRTELIQDLQTLIEGDSPEEHSAHQAERLLKEGHLKEEINTINFVLQSLASQVPRGDRPDILEALVSASKPNSITAKEFNRIFSEAMKLDREKMQKSSDYFKKRRNNDGTYNVDESLKKAYVHSGQVDVLIDSLDKDKQLHRSLECRLNAYYAKGPENAETAATAALTVIPFAGEVGGAFLIGAKGLEGASLLARSVYLGGRAVGVIGAAAGVSKVSEQIAQTCFAPTVLTSTTLTCEPKAQLVGALNQAKSGECASTLLSALPALAAFKPMLKVEALASKSTETTAKSISPVQSEVLEARLAKIKNTKPKAEPAPPEVVIHEPTPLKDSQMRIWKLQEAGNTMEAKKLSDALKSELTIGEIHTNEMMAPSSAQPHLITLKSGVKAIWKPMYGSSGSSGYNEIAAYKIDEKLGTKLVPMTVEREINGVKGSLQVFVEATDNVVVKPRPESFSFFDTLINNPDRHGGNYLTREGRPIAIDNGIAFEPPAGWESQKRNFLRDVRIEIRPIEFERLQIKGMAQELKATEQQFGRASQEFNDKAKELLPKMTAAVSKEKQLRIESRNKMTVMLPERAVYQRLKNTSDQEWTETLKSELSPEAIQNFLQRKNETIEACERAIKIYGDDVFRAGPFSPLVRDARPKK